MAGKNPFEGLGTGHVLDALGRLKLAGAMADVKPYRSDAQMVGRARTLLYGPRRGSGASDMGVISAVRAIQPGEVLVIATGCYDGWLYGDNLAHSALYQGLAGMVTDSYARDGAALAAIDFPCFGRGLSTVPPYGLEPVGFDIPIVCGGIQVRPGDMMVGDCDGIVVVPHEREADVVRQIPDLLEIEELYGKALTDRAELQVLLDLLKRKATPI